jgi:eukaryotic-like serine/threonine-protein kinase
MTQAMDSSRERAEEVFCAAIELNEPAKRLAFVEQACAGDDGLRSMVEEMLAEQNRVEILFGKDVGAGLPVPGLPEVLDKALGFRESVQTILSDKEEAGRQIGPYKLLERIGEGGCGVVHMAEQTRPVRRRVALKLIKLGMDTRNVIARFELERQALALMDHPNIARVLDAGATDMGRPYVVMELVQGTKITAYCDRERLTVRERLRLFIQVCHAIQHAHQKGIIHRDIKPSNILITVHDGQPVPKVIDFGIAKATGGQKLADHTVFTAIEQFVGTPAYISPEQVEMSGLDVDTRSDIYSLGVLLYELLTGKTPFESKELLESGLDAMRRTLREGEPLCPSTKLDKLRGEELTQTALHRQVEPRRLKLLLKGDLDWIVMKALEKERSRRYETASALAMDVQRHLDNEPVVARPPSRVYRLQKMVRRNKTSFLAMGAVSLALIGGLGASTWMYFRERRALQEQSRLLQVESRLRSEAEARAKIARAAVLLNRGKTAEADQLVDKIELPVTEASLEAAGVFRALGVWHVAEGRWVQAAERFLQLLRANQVDKTDLSNEATIDLLRAGPVLVALGRLALYQQIVREAGARFAATDNAVAAEEALKFCTIGEMDTATRLSLEPLVALAKRSFGRPDRDIHSLAWRAFALSLFEYRRGDFSSAIYWGERSLGYADSAASRIAMSHLVLAMANCRLHQIDVAQTELALGRKPVEQKLPKGLEAGLSQGDSTSGFWHDWLHAYLLLKEATACVEAYGP